MASVTAKDAAYVEEVLGNTIVGAEIDGSDLVLNKNNGDQVVVGEIVIPGPEGPPGSSDHFSNIITKTGTHTLILSDSGKTIEMDVASNNELQVPENVDVDFEVGTLIEGVQAGVGVTSIVGLGGVVINTPTGLDVSARYGHFWLLYRGSDQWYAYGDLS